MCFCKKVKTSGSLKGSDLRIRQLVMAAKERDQLASQICEVFDLEIAFYDPGIIHFGLENVLIPVGNTFIEIVSPIEENTAAERFINKRSGDGGYMVIIEVDDFVREKNRISENKIEIVWEADRKENGVHAQAIHLNPKQVGGAIVSLDQMKPRTAWLWAGHEWERHINRVSSNRLVGVHIQSSDPKVLMSKWEKALGKKGGSDNLTISLNESYIKFTEELDERGEGINAFEISVKNKEDVLEKAKDLNLLENENICIGGVNFLLD